MVICFAAPALLGCGGGGGVLTSLMSSGSLRPGFDPTPGEAVVRVLGGGADPE